MTQTTIAVNDVKVSPAHRAIKPWLLEQLKQSMGEHGYNVAYPIVIDRDGTLVEGRHRLVAANANGIAEVPFIYKPVDVPAIRFGLQCNADGQLTAADDVFDLAELCWYLNTVAGETSESIAAMLGWDRSRVAQHKSIKDKLHRKSWDVTRNSTCVTADKKLPVTDDVTHVTWQESHFRALLKHLPCPNGDRNLMRHQIRAINEIMDSKKITTPICDKVAQKHAWYATLARRMNDELAPEVGLRERIRLYKNIQNGVFGKSAPQNGDQGIDTFGKAITALNGDVLKVKLYHGDTLRILPQLDDKSIDLVVTDPPYNTTDHAWDQYGTDEEFIGWMQEWTTILKPKLKDNYHLFIFCDPDYMASLEVMLKANGWPIKSRIIWEYRNLVKGRDVTDKFIENYQVCFHCGTHPLNWSEDWDDSRFMVQRHATPQSNFTEGKHHPTAKPLSLIKLLVELGSKPGDLVVDMFGGGGTTGEACKEVGQRRCVLIERDDTYCNVIENRLKIKRVSSE